MNWTYSRDAFECKLTCEQNHGKKNPRVLLIEPGNELISSTPKYSWYSNTSIPRTWKYELQIRTKITFIGSFNSEKALEEIESNRD